MTDAAADEVDVARLARAIIPVRAAQAHAIPDHPYQPRGPWAPDPQRHHRVLRDEPEDEWIGATAQNNYVEHPYRCRLCDAQLTGQQIEEHQCR